jgi:hypothetical protein
MKKMIMTVFATFAMFGGAIAAQHHVYYAVCTTGHGSSGWAGPARNSYAAARTDVTAHMRSFPYHIADIVSN